jgi:hypothetical protein
MIPYDTRQVLDGLLIGQFNSVPHPARLIRALAITRLAGLDELQRDVIEKIDRVWRTKGGATSLKYFANEYKSAGLQVLDDIAARE